MATTRAKYLGHVDIVRNQPLPCHTYLLRKKKQGRIKKTVFGQRCEMKHSEKNAHRDAYTLAHRHFTRGRFQNHQTSHQSLQDPNAN